MFPSASHARAYLPLHRLDLVLAVLEARLGLRLASRDPQLRGQLLDQRLSAVRGVGTASRGDVVASAGAEAVGSRLDLQDIAEP